MIMSQAAHADVSPYAIFTAPFQKLAMSSTCQWIDPIDDLRWADLVGRHPSGSVFQSRGWLEALRRVYGYAPTALVTVARDGTLTGGLLFCSISSWLTGRRLVSLPFSDYCDPLVDDEGDLQRLLEALNAVRTRWKYVELRPRRDLRGINGGFAQSERFYWHRVDLTPSLDDLFASFHKNHVARKIRRSERENLVYEDGSSDRLLQSFYQLVLKTRRRHRLPPQPREWFRALLDCLSDRAKVRVAFKDGVAVASMLTIRDRDTMIYKYGASDADYHSLGGMQFLLWRTIQDAREQGCVALDLGRSKVDSLGEVAFKDHWGAAREGLVYWRNPVAGEANSVKRMGGALAGQVFAVLPARLLIAAGRGLYRHIG